MHKLSWEEALNKLESGEIRSAEKVDEKWQVHTFVKECILEAFKAGELVEEKGFVDKHNLMPQEYKVENGVRLVPGGSSIRRGSYLSKGVIVMPPSYVNVGAYVDEGTMIDSHVLVGSCAQIGKRVHLSAGVQIGGVLEPIGMAPVIIEDDAFIGAGSVIVEGIKVGTKAVIAPGVTLSKGTPIYDIPNEKIILAEEGVPDGAVVVPGTRPLSDKYPWGNKLNLSLQCPIIVKYRDEKSDTSLKLEDFLR